MKKSVKKILSFVFVLIISVSAVVLYKEYTKEPEEIEIYKPTPAEIEVKEEEKKEEIIEDEKIKMAPDVDLTKERAKYNNNDIIGRLELPNLFNVLLVKGSDNDYYLSRSISKEYDIRGSEFIDYRVNANSKQINVYGHNSRDEKIQVPFLKLAKKIEADDMKYFKENPYIILQHDGGKSVYKIFAIKQVYRSNVEHMNVSTTGQEFVQHIKNITTGEGTIYSESIDYDENSDIIVLQTCSHDWNNALYLIVGIKIDY